MGLLDAFRESTPFFLTAAALFGLVIGSFLNVVTVRLPVMLERQWRRDCQEFLGTDAAIPPAEIYNLVTPGSHCPKCQHPISALENIPLLSYLVLGGKCKACRAAIPLRYPLTEAATGILFIVVAWKFGVEWKTVAGFAIAATLVCLTAIDLEHQLLPDVITLPLLWLGLLLNTQTLFTDSDSAIIGAVAGYLSLWLTFHLFKLATGKEGMGHGDFKLLAALGAWLGWQLLPLIILLSSLVGAVVGIAMIAINRHERSAPMPFGPFLAAAGFIGMLWGHDLLKTYLDVAGLNR